jgi:hypothetical protein
MYLEHSMNAGETRLIHFLGAVGAVPFHMPRENLMAIMSEFLGFTGVMRSLT